MSKATKDRDLTPLMVAALEKLHRERGRGVDGFGNVRLDGRTGNALVGRGLAVEKWNAQGTYVITDEGAEVVS